MASSFFLSRWLFLRLIGLTYLIAFLSLWGQIDGLIGGNGILPAASYLGQISLVAGPERFWRLPTLCWLNSSDTMLHALCAGGSLLSLLLIFGIAPAPCLFFLWAFYLSLSSVCREFLNFQWDALLLEAGFLAIFIAPLQLRSTLGRAPPPRSLAVWLLRWLLFRLVFSSGVVKLASGDPAWRSLTALTYHYETQPLPTWIGWYAHQLPGWFQAASVVVMFFIELVLPFSIFASRRVRMFGFAGLVFLQVLIAATGNYCFFNLLSLSLCLFLLDDSSWPRRWQERLLEKKEAVKRLQWPLWILAPISAVILFVTGAILLGTVNPRIPWPTPVIELYSLMAPFRSTNGYGLFAVMTTSRPEIVVEGSNDGEHWLAYEFKWKPGDVRRRPGFVAPHQPRLDWQMWFAALGNYEENRWFMEFLIRLLQGSRPVLGLVAHNPFPEAPPRYARALVYDYHFTDLATRRSDSAWWRREYKGSYCPVVSLERRGQ